VFARIFTTSVTGTDFLNEAEIRAGHIDPAPAVAGWGRDEVEAKAWDRTQTEDVGQAADNAGKLAVRFTFAGNGQGIHGSNKRAKVKLAEMQKIKLFSGFQRYLYAAPAATAT
jgi:hypothetical protein